MTVSPEQSGNPPTPMGAGYSLNATTPGGENSATESDADTTLVDVTDTTWGAVVSHRLNNSSSLTELSPAIQSGYLIKRSGVRPEDPPVAMEVNVIHSEGNNPRAYEALLREMLNYFRGLGTLARLRGVVDRETDVRPWHVAAAEKGVKALYQLM
jgi:mediator of RNA polymerase II transcription subunit 13